MKSKEQSISSIHTLTTLAIDIGGTGIKAMVLDEQGNALSDRHLVSTPHPGTPEAVMKVICTLVAELRNFDRFSVGFPGVVHQGTIRTAVNLDSQWLGFDLANAIAKQFNKPVHVANDADIQGFGAISGYGSELVITLGTGFGSALFVQGNLMPNLEIAPHLFYQDKTYEQLLGKDAFEREGKKQWNKYLYKAISALENMFHYDKLYIGGGHTAHINFDLPGNALVISNIAGILGGIALWRE